MYIQDTTYLGICILLLLNELKKLLKDKLD